MLWNPSRLILNGKTHFLDLEQDDSSKYNKSQKFHQKQRDFHEQSRNFIQSTNTEQPRIQQQNNGHVDALQLAKKQKTPASQKSCRLRF